MLPYLETSAYRAGAIAMRLILDGGDPFPVGVVTSDAARPALKFVRSVQLDEAVMSWKTSPLNAYASLCSAMAAATKGDNSKLVRFLSDSSLMDKLAELDDALRNSKIETGE